MPPDNSTSTTNTALRRLDRPSMARLVANDIPDGSFVNLGIGLPVLVAGQLPPGREIILHSENGILGMGPLGSGKAPDPDLVNASKEPVSLLAGASISDSTLSFTMMRGGHLDLSVLGGLEVSAQGDLANWHTNVPNAIPGVGGAMDLAIGAKRAFVMMEHQTRDGRPKIVERCSLPLTGAGVVDRIYTDLAVIDVKPDGLWVQAMVEGLTREQLQARTGAPLRWMQDCRTLSVNA
ncbi:MAG: 3-oxoacid CoA-transferase subunit B [Ottowia sp.]|uniref:3-oxoacid CoA-transferase subunit B n=1 Tax=Ottowia sp. TaxID=1898956 RepID=UPI003C7540FB